MELFQLRYFLAAAKLLHFTRAAEERFVSQPSLSQQIANLERELGTPLFYRQGRSVSLTDAGEVLKGHAERLIETESSAKQAVQEVIGLQQGTLAIWTLPTPGQHLLPPLLAKFRLSFPEIQISLREMVPAQSISEGVGAGKADIGIVHLPQQMEGLEESVILEEDLALVVPAGHWTTRAESVSLSSVANEDFIWAPEGANRSHPLYAACLSAGFIPKIACMSGSAQGMQSLVAAGLGISLLPRLAIAPPEGSVLVELDSPRPTRTLAAIWRADRLSHAARAFLSSLLGNAPACKQLS